MALLALPAYYASRLSPDTSELFKLLLILDIVLAVGSDVTRVARGPLVALGRLSRALGASKVIA